MNERSELLYFVKAMSDAERLRVIGALVKRPAPVAEVASALGIPVRDAFDHLEHLVSVGVIHKSGEEYSLDMNGLEQLSKNQFKPEPRPSYIPAPGLDEKSRKVLVAYLNADGTIKQIPSQASKLRIILEYLVTAFIPGANYTEKEVNTILRHFHLDTAGLRRDLVDSGLMKREADGSRYWRVV